MMRWTTRQRMNLLKMKIQRKRMAVFLNGLRNGLSENKYPRKLRGLRRDSRCSMTDDTKIAIEACCQATSGFGPRSVGPSSFWIGLKSVRSKSNHLSVRSDSISKNVGPRHWTGPDRDRTEVVHPCPHCLDVFYHNACSHSRVGCSSVEEVA